MPVVNPQRTAIVRGAPPILIVNATYDPSTAYPWAFGLLSQIEGSVLLEQIVEKASGQDMNTFLAKNVFIPLEMAETFYATEPELPGELRGYSWDADTEAFKDMTTLNPGLPGGAGAVVSTLDDLHTYVRALCTGELLKPATQAERLTGVTMDGEGIALLGQFCGHNGTIFGFSSEAFYLPAKDAVIIINVNRLDLDDQSQSTELFLMLTKAFFSDDVNW